MESPAPAVLPSAQPAQPARRVGGIGGLFRGTWERLSRLLSVSSDKGRNRQFWTFALGQAVVSVGATAHSLGTVNLVSRGGQDPGRAGNSWAVSHGAQALANVTTGAVLDSIPGEQVSSWTLFGRFAALGALSLLVTYFLGVSPFFAVFLFLIFSNSFLRSVGATAGSVGIAQLVGNDPVSANKANAVYGTLMSLTQFVTPMLIGAFIGLALMHLGPARGYGLIYIFAGLCLLAPAVGYKLFLRFPRRPLFEVRRRLYRQLRPWPWAALSPRHPIRGVSAGHRDGRDVLVVEVATAAGNMPSIPAEFSGYPVSVVAYRRGLDLVRSSRFLRRGLYFMTIEAILLGALGYTALPVYIRHVLDPAGAQALAGLTSRIPLVGSVVQGLTTQEGLVGLYQSASELGVGASSLAMFFGGDRPRSELNARLASFRSRPSAKSRLDDGSLEAAARAAENAVERTLKDYRAVRQEEIRQKKPASTPTPAEFEADVLRLAAEGINGEIFSGAKTHGEIAGLMEETGLAGELKAWAERRFAAVVKDARRSAETGLNRQERQARWSLFLAALGILAYWGVFFSPRLGVSLGAMFLSSLLQGFSAIAVLSLTQNHLRKRFPDGMGKIFSSTAFYQLLWSVFGALLLGSLFSLAPPRTALMILGILMVPLAAQHLVEPFFVLPVEEQPEPGGFLGGAVPQGGRPEPKPALFLKQHGFDEEN